MGFLRRLLGGSPAAAARSGSTAEPIVAEPTAVELDEDERARELELARFESERTDDLVRRQQMYADRSWTPPAQGGERRSDDADAAGG
jgi:broad specificity phosphatase PhoE